MHRHAVTVPFDLERPLVTLGRFVDELRQARPNARWHRIKWKFGLLWSPNADITEARGASVSRSSGADFGVSGGLFAMTASASEINLKMG